MIYARPHHCEEAAIGIGWGYLPCNKPATWIVIHHGWSEIAMCTECAWHNLKNRGAIGARPYDPNRYAQPAKLDWHVHDSVEATPLTDAEKQMWADYYAPPQPSALEIANKRWKAARLGVAYGMGEIKGAQILGQYPLPATRLRPANGRLGLMKYVMLETSEGGKLPIIFPELLVHDHMYKMVQATLARGYKTASRPISAGFVSFGMDVTCHGLSESMGGMPSSEYDAARILLHQQAGHMPDEMMQKLYGQMKEQFRGR